MKKLVALMFAISVIALVSCNSATKPEVKTVDTTVVKDTVVKVDSLVKKDSTAKVVTPEVKK